MKKYFNMLKINRNYINNFLLHSLKKKKKRKQKKTVQYNLVMKKIYIEFEIFLVIKYISFNIHD